jgi:hypothetical protein
MKKLILLLVSALPLISLAQNWSDNVANVMYSKCASCHHNGGIAPFSLTTYSEASSMASIISTVVADNSMPPYPPNENYQQYSHSRTLNAIEKAMILDWVANGTPEGNTANTPPPPVFNTGSVLGAGDLTIRIPNYYSKAQAGMDDYVCFSIPAGLTQDRKIRAMEIVPGNREIVHHALIYVDETGTYPTDTTGGNCGGPQNATLISGYTPGASPLVFPSGAGFKLGMKIPSGSNIVFAMHYPEGSFGMLDSTKVIFHFYPTTETGVREVFAAEPLQNWSLVLPPNQVTNATASYPASGSIPIDLSVLSVFPHMHLVGKQIKAYGLSAIGDTIRYIDIPKWDFHWQDFYFFKHIQKTPLGSTLHAEAVYDNTVNNPNNPNSPPQWVFAGESTTDEMMMVYFHYMYYQPGDELIDLESLMNLGTESLPSIENTGMTAHPNPFNGAVVFDDLTMKPGTVFSLYIYDAQGKQIKKIAEKQLINSAENSSIVWDGTDENGVAVPKGTYIASVNQSGKFTSIRIVKQ